MAIGKFILIDGKIVNVEDPANSNKVEQQTLIKEEKDIYKYGEQLTNKIWVDNKQIYRFISNIEPLKQRESRKIEISNKIETVIDYKVIIYNNDKWYNIKYSNEFADDIYIENGFLCLDLNSDWTDYNGYIVVEYTKK